MTTELVTMSTKELNRLEIIQRVIERRMSQKKAAELLDLCERQTRRLCTAYEQAGPAALTSKKRGRPSNRRLSEELRAQIIAIVRERYADFGPKLAHEKLVELHGICISRETLRKWLAEAGIWFTRELRRRVVHQPRHRRDCFGELVQIDGCEHAWFEDRGPTCTLLVYVDDATGRLMELQFVRCESAFDYFESTTAYLKRHGKPVAFYSDKHSIFHVCREGSTDQAKGITQFGRALSTLNIDIICANSPQAKGRVERMNKTLQDRLVKELRLHDISTMEQGNAFLPEFMEDYNRRFGREPRNSHDAHRPLREDDDLKRIFTWQEERTMTRNLTVHFKRVIYLVNPTPEALALAGKRVQIYEWENGQIEIHCEGKLLPYSIFDKNPVVSQGAIVENKRLGSVLSMIQSAQVERDQKRLASKKLTLRQKERLTAVRATAGAPTSSEMPDRPDTALSYFKDFEAKQKERRKILNQRHVVSS